MQHDLTIDNQGFPAFRADLNNALQALGTQASGATEPTTTFAYQVWADTANDLLKVRNAADSAWVSVYTLSTGEPADASIAKVDTAQTYTASQRGTVTTDNDMSFDMSATNNFTATPTGAATLTFTNITAGQSGNIYVNNAGGYAISAAATTLISSGDLTKLSTAGAYWISYYSADGTNVSVAVSPALTSAGA